MTLTNKRHEIHAVLVFILGVMLFIPGCAPLLVGAGAVGGYEMATQNGKK